MFSFYGACLVAEKLPERRKKKRGDECKLDFRTIDLLYYNAARH